MGSSGEQTLNVGLPASWGSLVPALQHTRFADALISNAYESLVRNKHGTIAPLAASSWSVSEDKTTYSFQIDTARKFSNGENLSAKHFKSAWEHGLALEEKSANASLADVLYRVKGYKDFAKTGAIEGLKVLSDDRLEIAFEKPYRSALEDLAGARYAAAIYSENQVFGTGPYVLEKDSADKAEFKKNPHTKIEGLFDRVNVQVFDVKLAETVLQKKTVDVFYFFSRGGIRDCDTKTDVKCLSGMEAVHESSYLNGKPGRFFSSASRRRAFQALVWRILGQNSLPDFAEQPLFRLDAQLYLPFQAGRLQSAEVDALVHAGDAHIDQLILDSQASPLHGITSRSNTILLDALKKAGVKFDDKSGKVTFKEALEDFYKGHKSDVIFGGFSVHHGDPDGAYHILGKYGSITSPMIQRPAVAELLEEGREILAIENLHAHYQKVSRAVLTDVPFVHLGMVSDQIAYNTDRVEADDEVLSRSRNGFHLFRKK